MRPDPTLRHFTAPWCALLKGLTAVASILLGALPLFAWLANPAASGWLVLALLGPLTVLVTGLLTVRGYQISAGGLRIRRLLHTSRLDLTGLRTVTPDPTAMNGSLRLFGNGGLFGFYGWFWNRRLGRYRAWVTSPKLAVVLRFADRRPMVVSPDDPAGFAGILGDQPAAATTSNPRP